MSPEAIVVSAGTDCAGTWPVIFERGCAVEVKGSDVFIESRICAGYEEGRNWGHPTCEPIFARCKLPPLEPGEYTVHVGGKTMQVRAPATYCYSEVPFILPDREVLRPQGTRWGRRHAPEVGSRGCWGRWGGQIEKRSLGDAFDLAVHEITAADIAHAAEINDDAPTRAGVTVETSALADELEAAAKRVDSMLVEVEREEREAQLTLNARNEALDRWNARYQGVADTVTGLYELTEKWELAAVVRPTARRRGGIPEVEDPIEPVEPTPEV